MTTLLLPVLYAIHAVAFGLVHIIHNIQPGVYASLLCFLLRSIPLNVCILLVWFIVVRFWPDLMIPTLLLSLYGRFQYNKIDHHDEVMIIMSWFAVLGFHL